ncbi:hypothetical protein GCM10020358_49560 [Amorphoplanes nipponensis]|uniref:Uncharacterized protein n=1 Tax=Actinoplanes nipponensis TaxID=135950 RepID=A0A919MKQ4_9ACTN|nr:hypothetical protein Ani05nite_66530 [Actinoplanes nipponensis]
MGGYGFQVGPVVVLVLLNATFSDTEIALISLRESQVQRLERASRTGRVMARLARPLVKSPMTGHSQIARWRGEHQACFGASKSIEKACTWAGPSSVGWNHD